MVIRILAALLAAGTAVVAVDKPSTGVPVQIVVTVAHHHSGPSQAITKADLTVSERYEALPITKFTPLSSSDLELFLLVDDCSNCELGPKLDELRGFIGSQSPATASGVAYIHNGEIQIVEKPTKDRDKTIQALTAPSGSVTANPFGALTDLIRNWPPNSPRRAVVMIANGINPTASDEFQNPFAEKAIETAERAGVIVYAIYNPSANFLSSDFSQIHSGQVLLSHVAYESGGEAYFLGPEPLPSLAPVLSDITEHLASQYLVEFLAQPGAEAALHPITAKASLPNVEIMAPDMVWVPAAVSRRPGH